MAWTERQHERRNELIDKEIAGTMSAKEIQELNHLQQELSDHISKMDLHPFSEVRRLRMELLRRVHAKWLQRRDDIDKS
jgi:hypothetical protein